MRGKRLTAILVSAGVLALIFAAASAYVAHAASSAEAEMERSDAAFGIEPSRKHLWQVDGPVKRLLGLQGDLDFRKANRLYELSRERRRVAFGFTSRNLRAEALLALARASREPLSPHLRSRAENLEALLTVQEGLTDDPRSRALMIQRSLDHFRRAIRLDPTNEQAKFNLELVLRALSPSARTRQSGLDPNAPLGQTAGTTRLRGGFGY